jgi:hypothetical protein
MVDFPKHLWMFITGFGGAAVMVPLALAVAAWLAVGYRWRTAALWLFLLATGAALVTVTKIAFLGWGIGVRALDFTGISGHSMLSTAVFPVMLYVILLPAPRMTRTFGVLVGLGIGTLVGLSRVALSAHSVSETIAGCLLGGAVALAYVALHRETPTKALSSSVVAVSLLVVIASLYDFHLPTQRWVTGIALDLSGHDKPFIRARWKKGLYDKKRLYDKKDIYETSKSTWPGPLARQSPFLLEQNALAACA